MADKSSIEGVEGFGETTGNGGCANEKTVVNGPVDMKVDSEEQDSCQVELDDDVDPKSPAQQELSTVLYESLREYKSGLRNDLVEEEKKKGWLFTNVLEPTWLTCLDIVAAFYIYYKHIVNLEAVLVVMNALAVTSFYLYYVDEEGDYLACKLDFSILSFAVVFPLTFLMQQAFQRREQALTNFADLKALVVSTTMANLMWNFPDAESKEFVGRKNLPDDFPAKVRASNTEFLNVLYEYLSMPMVSRARNFIFPAQKKRTETVRKLQDRLSQRMSCVFKKMYANVEILKSAGLPANEASRINQYHWFIYQRFELLRNKKYYRTPQATRSFGRVYMFVLPWFFGPYFAYVAGLQDGSTTMTNRGFAFALSALTFLVLMGLINVARLLEDPFQEAGFDNVQLKLEIASAHQAIAYFYQQAEIARLQMKQECKQTR